MIKAPPPRPREKMTAMIDIVEQGKQNFRKGQEYRPLDGSRGICPQPCKGCTRGEPPPGTGLIMWQNSPGQGVDVSPAVDGLWATWRTWGSSLALQRGKPHSRDLTLRVLPGRSGLSKRLAANAEHSKRRTPTMCTG